MEDPKLQSILEQFEPEYQAVVTGVVPTIAAESFGDAFKLSDRDRRVLENSFRLYLMAMLSINEWATFISDYTILDKATAENIIKEILFTIPDEIKFQLEEIRIGEAPAQDSPNSNSGK